MVLAKSNPSISLEQHLMDVAELSRLLSLNINEDRTASMISVFIGAFHDIGKINPDFQSYLNGNKNEYVLHNVFGADYMRALMTDSVKICGVEISTQIICNCIRFHHPVKDNDSIAYLSPEDIDRFVWWVGHITDLLNDQYGPNTFEVNIDQKKVAKYKEDGNVGEEWDYSFLNEEDTFTYLRILLTADSLASKAEHYDMNIFGYYQEVISRHHYIFKESDISTRPNGYDERYDSQFACAKELNESSKPVCVLNAPTGYGKTQIGLQFLLRGNTVGYWICHNNILAHSTYNSIVNELINMQLQDKVSVGLLLGGEYKYGDDNSDIIVTNIDNFTRPTFKSETNALPNNYRILNCNCIIDEFDKYMDRSGIMKMFTLIYKSRKNCLNHDNQHHLLLMSATPCELLLGNNPRNNNSVTWKEIQSEKIDSKQFVLHFLQNEIDFGKIDLNNTLICANAVKTCQKLYGTGYIDDIYHSQYIPDAIQSKRDKLFQEHGKNGTSNSSWIGTNAISTGLDISFNNAVCCWMGPSMLLQILGRINRFRTAETPSHIYLSTIKGRSEKAILAEMVDGDNSQQRLKKYIEYYYDHLKKRCGEGNVITLKELKEATKEYENQKLPQYRQIFTAMLNESKDNLNDLSYSFAGKKTDVIYISDKPTLRGNDSKVFVKLQNASGSYVKDTLQLEVRKLELNKMSDDLLKTCLRETWEYMIANNLLSIPKSKMKELLKDYSSIQTKEKLLGYGHCEATPIHIPRSKIYYDETLGVIY